VGEHHFGLVGDRQIGAAGGEQLDRRRGVGGGVDADVEPGFLEVAELLRHVDPGVVGVGVEVERQAERLRLAGHVFALRAAGGEAEAEREQGERQGERADRGAPHRRSSIAT
jgi:hypothetical protein